MHRARVPVSLAAAFALIGCVSRPGPPKCAEVPVPAPDDFAVCGAMSYHAGPGPNVPFTIRIKASLPVGYELVDACVLLDEYSLLASGKLAWSGNVFRGKHVVKVQAVVRSATNTFTIRTASEIATLQTGELELVAESGPHIRWVKPKDSKCE